MLTSESRSIHLANELTSDRRSLLAALPNSGENEAPTLFHLNVGVIHEVEKSLKSRVPGFFEGNEIGLRGLRREGGAREVLYRNVENLHLGRHEGFQPFENSRGCWASDSNGGLLSERKPSVNFINCARIDATKSAQFSFARRCLSRSRHSSGCNYYP